MISSLELARLCGVSQGTVDRALHDRPGVSSATRKRVLELAAKHGYRANPAVHEVMRGGSTIVGGIVPSFASVFFQDLMQALARELAQRGLRLLLAQADHEREFHEVLGDFAARRAAAAVVVPPREGLRLRRDASGLRLVALGSPCAGARFLSPDECATGLTATRHLLGLGHRRIVHLTYARRAHGINARGEGYLSAMSAAGLDPRVLVAPDPRTIVAAVEGGATALFCLNDWLALAAIRALGDAGFVVPRDVSVLGVDASPTFVALYPGITSLRYPFEELATIAAAHLASGAAPGSVPSCAVAPGTTVGPPPA